MKAVKIYFVDGKQLSEKCVRLGFDNGKSVDYFNIPTSQVLDKGCYTNSKGEKYDRFIIIPIWLANSNGLLNKDGWNIPYYTHDIIDFNK